MSWADEMDYEQDGEEGVEGVEGVEVERSVMNSEELLVEAGDETQARIKVERRVRRYVVDDEGERWLVTTRFIAGEWRELGGVLERSISSHPLGSGRMRGNGNCKSGDVRIGSVRRGHE
jgi:hypothetical protein